MDNFFRNRYDLYKFISSNYIAASKVIRKAIFVVTGEDLEQDVKDFCLGISESEDYDSSLDLLSDFWEIIQDNFGVFNKIKTNSI